MQMACATINHYKLINGESPMPSTLTLKNIPDTVYERLKFAAQTHQRSMNSEAIVCLEAALKHSAPTPSERLSDRLSRARAIRATLPTQLFVADDIDTAKRNGRP
jgi:antitoxin FitA